jgi:DNA-binding CsgD family transcriptional regulator
MRTMKKSAAKHAVIQKAKSPLMAEAGLALMDLSLRIIASDRGAAAILNYPNQPGDNSELESCIPMEIQDMIRSHKPTELSSVKAHFRMGKSEYTCRAYVVESYNGVATQPMVALHLEKDSSATEAIYEVAAKYHLTDREQEALRGISLGLATKELAERMNISPNTVKAFLRLIMIKMGVTTRAGIVAKILQNCAMLDERGGQPSANHQQMKKMAV